MGQKPTIVPFYCTLLLFFGYTASMPLFSRISPGSLTNNYTLQAEEYEPKCYYKWPSSSEINLAKFNEF